jgi:drug/metabolite transporter (DMT)-like permease
MVAGRFAGVSPVALALLSAFLFGAMTVSLRGALGRSPDPLAGALATILVATAVSLPFAAGSALSREIWPFLAAGVLGPGLSQLLFTYAVRDAGPSRASVVVGTAPLFSVAMALVFLREPLEAGLVAGAVLVVAGGILLVSERGRPAHVRLVGLAAALGCTIVFAARDNLVRWLSGDTPVEPALATTATLVAGGVVVAAWAWSRGARLGRRALAAYAPPGLLFGLSYVSLFHAFYAGRVSVVAPLVATESLWGVLLSALLLRRHELVGVRLLGGAALVVAGGALIGVTR